MASEIAIHPKVQEALDLIQEAQTTVLRAAEALSPLPGFSATWVAVCNLHDQIKACWQRVEYDRRNRCPQCGAVLGLGTSCCHECEWVRP